jgi:hypothetical protein
MMISRSNNAEVSAGFSIKSRSAVSIVDVIAMWDLK